VFQQKELQILLEISRRVDELSEINRPLPPPPPPPTAAASSETPAQRS